MNKYNKSVIFKYCWKLFKNQDVKTDLMFAICLIKSWQIAKQVPIFEEMYKKYYPAIYNYIKLKIHINEVAEELSNDVFLKANECLYDSEKSKLNTWLYNIAKNKVIDYYRSNNKYKCIISINNFKNESGNEIFQFVDDFRTESVIENNELRYEILNSIDALKPEFRVIAELYFIDDMSYKDIAVKLQISLSIVKTSIYKIRKKLQPELIREYINF